MAKHRGNAEKEGKQAKMKPRIFQIPVDDLRGGCKRAAKGLKVKKQE